ncbi:MAG: type III-B CRISPR module-associated Cmr3 family protein [Pseudonocardiaceae bacterium]
MSNLAKPPEYQWLTFTPRDTVFIRDGRPFDAAAQTQAATVWPTPTTVAGATKIAFGAEPDAVCGPVLTRDLGGDAGGRDVDGEWETYFPVPRDLVRDDESCVYRLRPESAGTACTDLDVECWLLPPEDAGATKDLSGWLPADQLTDYLAGTLPVDAITQERELSLEEDPLCPELRVGLARESDRRVKQGHLYQVTHLRPRSGWVFAAGCVLPAGWNRRAAGPVPFGGRGRLADVAPVSGLRLPEAPSNFPEGRVLVYLATPAIWPSGVDSPGGWRIPVPDGARLVAAAVGEPQPVATTTADKDWKSNRVLRWAVPAGSVYLLQFDDPARAKRWACDEVDGVHGTAYGRPPNDRLRTAGFGLVLTGVWT